MEKFKAPDPIDGELLANYMVRVTQAFEAWANESAATYVAERVAKCAEATADDITEWERSPKNNGPFAEEAYRINVHLGAMLSNLVNRLRTWKS